MVSCLADGLQKGMCMAVARNENLARVMKLFFRVSLGQKIGLCHQSIDYACMLCLIWV